MKRERRNIVESLLFSTIMLATGLSLTRAEFSKTVAGIHDRSGSSVASLANNTRAQARLQRSAHEDATANKGVKSDEVEVGESECPQNLELRWMSEMQSSVYATPVITDLFSDGYKDIIVPSFVHHLEVLEAADGSSVPGWPAFHKSLVHASPVMYDLDFDGVQDILLTTYDGEILAFKDNGDRMAERLVVPRLRVRRDWYKGLAADPIDHSHPDIGNNVHRHDTQGRAGGTPGNSTVAKTTMQRRLLSPQHRAASGNMHNARRRQLLADTDAATPQPTAAMQQDSQHVEQQAAAEAALQELLAKRAAQTRPQPNTPTEVGIQDARQASNLVEQRATQSGFPTQGSQGSQGQTQNLQNSPDNQLSDEASETFQELFQDSGEHGGHVDVSGEAASHENPDEALEEEEEERYDEQHGEEGAAEFDADAMGPGEEDFSEDYDEIFHNDLEGSRAAGLTVRGGALLNDTNLSRGAANDAAIRARRQRDGWQDEEYEAVNAYQPEPDFAYIDAHLLCTPAIGDLDGDGHDELIVAISYFFDRQYYDDVEHSAKMPKDLDMSKYIASGVVAFDLRSRSVKWSTHLDLSTDSIVFRAYAYSDPTLADLDGDGKLEVILGTSVGFLYVLDHRGVSKPGWPRQMGEIQGQPACADVNGDGKPEVVAADTKGNVAAFAANGEEVWDRPLGSAIAQGVSIGDIDGDGEVEVVLGTTSGKLYALHGKTGADKPNFPFQTRGRIMAPVLITQLQGDEEYSLHLVVVSFDGFLYLVDGATGCADVVDIGETSYSMVLADDLNGDGNTDLLVTTMNGNVYAFQTGAKHHPLASWTSQVHGRSTQMARINARGIFATRSSRAARDVRGKSLPVRFEIVDSRVVPIDTVAAMEGHVASPKAGPYSVSVSLRGVGVTAMNSGSQPVIGLTVVYNQPGVYTLDIPCPRSQSTATVHIEMKDESNNIFVDEFSLSFHMHYYRLLKWIMAVPFTAASIAMLAMKLGSFNDQLPTLGQRSNALT